MHDPTPSCFRGGVSTGGLPQHRAGSSPCLTTSVYETHMGVAELTWSRAVLGLCLHADVHLSSSESPDLSTPLRFRLRPWLLWRHRGTRRFHVTDDDGRPRTIDFAWDLSRAAFAGGRPEPSSRFYLAIAVDGELFLLVGDPDEPVKIHRKIRASKPINPLLPPALISRKEQVFASDSATFRPYTTWVSVGGKDRRISIDLGPASMRDSMLCVEIDGIRVLQVKKLRWKFRGNERIEIDGKSKVSISWNVHQMLFPSDAAVSGEDASSEQGQAVFVFRFEDEEGRFGKNLWGYCGAEGNFFVGRKGRRLLKTSSSMSASSTASTGSNTSVMEWASVEETELKDSDGFTLMVCVSKRRC